MKCPQIVRALTCVMFIVGGVASSFAQAQDADWKFYGGKMQFCFYDKNSMTPAPNGYKVETKCIDSEEMDSLDIQKRVDIQKQRRIAAARDIQQQVSIRYEINCTNRMVRKVSPYQDRPSGNIVIARGFQYQFNLALIDNTHWGSDPPKGNEAMLLKTLCEF